MAGIVSRVIALTLTFASQCGAMRTRARQNRTETAEHLENTRLGDACVICLEYGGGTGCVGSCSGKSADCIACVQYGGGAGCVSRCSSGSPAPAPPGTSIDWYNPNAQVSRYFTVIEVTQGDSRRIPTSSSIQNNIVALAYELDAVRDAWGSGVGITSWYRPPAVNSEVGGAPNSQHLYGNAADIYPTNGNIYGMQAWLDNGIWANRALGYGAHIGFVHVDTRAGRIRWNY